MAARERPSPLHRSADALAGLAAEPNELQLQQVSGLPSGSEVSWVRR